MGLYILRYYFKSGTFRYPPAARLYIVRYPFARPVRPVPWGKVVPTRYSALSGHTKKTINSYLTNATILRYDLIMKDNQSVITANNVQFLYGSEEVLKSVSFDIQKGDYVGLIGQNGSGKSTLLKLLLGLLRPASGSVELFGESIEKFKHWEKIGYVPQRSGIFDQSFPATVEEIVEMGLTQDKNWSRTKEGKMYHALEMVEMAHLKHRQLRELSGGEQQRALIARALVNRPELILLDEPVVGVDTQSQHNFYQILRRLNKDLNLTLLLVSHDLDIVAHEADYLIMMTEGEICKCTKDMIEKDKKKYIALAQDPSHPHHTH